MNLLKNDEEDKATSVLKKTEIITSSLHENSIESVQVFLWNLSEYLQYGDPGNLTSKEELLATYSTLCNKFYIPQ